MGETMLREKLVIFIEDIFMYQISTWIFYINCQYLNIIILNHDIDILTVIEIH